MPWSWLIGVNYIDRRIASRKNLTIRGTVASFKIELLKGIPEERIDIIPSLVFSCFGARQLVRFSMRQHPSQSKLFDEAMRALDPSAPLFLCPFDPLAPFD